MHDRQGTVRREPLADLARDEVERLVPANAFPGAIQPPVAAPHRMQHAFLAVEPLRKAVCRGGEIAAGELMLGVTLELRDAPVLHMRDDTAAIGAIQRARCVDRVRHGACLLGRTHQRVPEAHGILVRSLQRFYLR